MMLKDLQQQLATPEMVASSSSSKAIIVGSSLPRLMRARLARLRCGDRSAHTMPSAPGMHHEFPYKAHMGSEWLADMIADMGFGDFSLAPILYADAQGINHRTLEDTLDVLKAFAATSPASSGSVDRALVAALMFGDESVGNRDVRRDPFAKVPRVASRCGLPKKYYLQQAQPRAMCH